MMAAVCEKSRAVYKGEEREACDPHPIDTFGVKFTFIFHLHYFQGLVPLLTKISLNMFFRATLVSLVAAAAGALAQGVGQGMSI
jgi:hypothetical protein